MAVDVLARALPLLAAANSSDVPVQLIATIGLVVVALIGVVPIMFARDARASARASSENDAATFALVASLAAENGSCIDALEAQYAREVAREARDGNPPPPEPAVLRRARQKVEELQAQVAAEAERRAAQARRKRGRTR